MKSITYLATIVTLSLSIAASAADKPKNLCVNGTFDAKGDDPLKGWTYNYEWLNNKHYMKNHEEVSLVANAGGKRNAVKLDPVGKMGSGTKIESTPIPYEPGYRYTCTLDVKGDFYRLYFNGYKWKPGVRPNDNPHLGDLRNAYKGEAQAGKSKSWKQISFTIPMENASAQSKQFLRSIRFITVYLWTANGAMFDNVVVTKEKIVEKE